MAMRCKECGGPLEGWAGEHHSPQCSHNEDDYSETERDIDSNYAAHEAAVDVSDTLGKVFGA